MTGLPPEQLAKYRALVPDIQFSDAAKDDVIGIIRNIMRVSVGIAWGQDSAQIALNQQFSKASISDSDCASVEFHEKIEPVDPVEGGAKNEIGYKEYAP